MKSLNIFAIFMCFLLGLSAKAELQFKQLHPVSQKSWMKLMHFISVDHPLIGDSRFYVSGSNSHSLDHEFSLNVARFSQDPQNYSCQFPARSQLLAMLTQTKTVLCPQIEDWKRKIDASSLSLVYVAQYISNPASVFGHTFLIAKSLNRPKGLHVTINNAANMPPNVSNYDYITKGLAGGFKAVNYIENFTSKNQEYGAIENRDMWIYDLDLSEYDVNQFLNHIWELDHSASEGYYFLTKNCSAFLVNSMAAVVNDIEFVSPDLTYFMPLESVKELRHRIVKSHFIPSARKSLSYRVDTFTPDQKDQYNRFFRLSDDKDIISNDPYYLSFMIDYFEFKKSQQNGRLNESQNRQYDQALLQRSKIAVVDQPVVVPPPPSPMESFNTSRIALSAYSSKHTQETLLSISPLYHSLLQKEAGFIPFSEVVLLDTQLNLKEQKIQELTLVRLTNHPLETQFDRNFSWTGSLFFENPRLEDKIHFNFDLKGGLTFDLKHSLGYFLVGPTMDESSRLVTEAELGLLFDSPRVRAKIASTYRFMRDNKEQQSLLLKVNTDLNQTFDLEYMIKYDDQYNLHHGLTLNYFF